MKFKTLHFLLFGDMNKPVNDLHRKSTRNDKLLDLNQKIGQYFYIICILAIILCLIGFIAVCFSICGISAVESGGMRNFINGGLI